MAGAVPVIPKFQFVSSTGAPLANGTVDVYLAGTTTRTNTWQDSALTILNTNPIVLDANGRCDIYLDSSLTYKFVLKNAGGATQWTADNITGAGGLSQLQFVQAGTGAVARTAQSKMRDVISIMDFGAAGDGAANDAAKVLLACNYAAPLGLWVDGGGKTYALGSALTVTSGRLRVRNAKFVALSGLTTTMLTLASASDGPAFENVEFDGGGYARVWVETELVDDASFSGCRFTNIGNTSSANVFGLMFDRARRASVRGCAFDSATSSDVTRFIYMQGDCQGMRIIGNSFANLASAGDDGDAIVCEEWGTDQNCVVMGNHFENIQKRLVKAGGNGWVIKGNTARMVSSGGLYSVFSLYGSDMEVDGNFVESDLAQVIYPIDIGADPTVPLVTNVRITNNDFRLIAYTSGSQDFIRLSSDVENLYVAGNVVDNCRYFLGNGSNFDLTNGKFIGNTTTACADHEFAFGTGALVNVSISHHRSKLAVASRSFVSATGSVSGLYLVGNNYSKTFGLTNDPSTLRCAEAHGNVNAGARETLYDYRNGVRWIYRASAPTSGTFAQGDVCWNTTPQANRATGWVCTAAGTPGTWSPIGWLAHKGPTANRPALTAADAGVPYFDTTLDADGKPIWWTGTAWVDATGLAV